MSILEPELRARLAEEASVLAIYEDAFRLLGRAAELYLLGGEAVVSEARPRADVVVTRVNGTSWTHLCVSPPPRDPRGTPLTTHTTPNRRALRDAAKRARRARKA